MGLSFPYKTKQPELLVTKNSVTSSSTLKQTLIMCSDIIEQVHGEQKKRDDALLKQVREARSEREQLIKQVEALKKQVQL